MTDLIDVELQRPLTYNDLLTQSDLLTRVLHETLRLWPIVHYGTFRELVRDAQVKGADGEPVTVRSLRAANDFSTPAPF